jgi:hypothetical protein
LSIRRVDCVDERVDNGVFEILVLKLLAKDESLDEEVNLFPVAFSVTHILRAEYAISIQPLDVKCKGIGVVVRKWYSPLLAFLPAVLHSCVKIRRPLAKQVLMYSMLRFVGPDKYGQDIDAIAYSTSDNYQ